MTFRVTATPGWRELQSACSLRVRFMDSAEACLICQEYGHSESYSTAEYHEFRQEWNCDNRKPCRFMSPRRENPCTLTLSPTSSPLIPKEGDIESFNVYTTPGDCPWTAASKVSWVGITSGSSGVGDGTVVYMVDEHTGAKARNREDQGGARH